MRSLIRVWTLAILVCVGLGLASARGSLDQGAGWTHSYSYNTVWIAEFNAALREGHFPPRWLAGAMAGFGASSFYFYPPLAFYAAALVGAVLPEGAHPGLILAWLDALTITASGLAMFAWLRPKTGPWTALAAAALYMLAPYHQLCVFVRGALGETVAYIVLPLLAASLERAVRSWRWTPALAVSYAALVLSHPIIAMLATVGVLPAYALYLVWSAPAEARLMVVVRGAAGAALGLALAAFYLGPATLLQSASTMDHMWGTAATDPYNWSLLRPDLWPQKPFSTSMAFLGWGMGALALAALVAALAVRREARSGEAIAWAAAALGGVALYAIPWIWHSPLAVILNKAQFPYRVLVAVDFAAVAAVALAFAHGRRWILPPLAAVVAAPLLWQGFMLTQSAYVFHFAAPGFADPETGRRLAALRAPDEHFPAALNFYDPRLNADYPGLSGLKDIPLAAPVDSGAKVTAASTFPDGTVAIAVEAERPTRIVLGKFYFPTWEVGRVQRGRDPVVASTAYGSLAQLSFVAEPGQHTYRARIVRSGAEKASDLVSLLALAVVLGLFAPSLTERLKKLRKAAI
ncbi:hypothetical protein [Caulobacter segnis]|uniref:hypothetical protein n=1 Tax=Caulobacter segnis TaxID=88688 RepID=UPI0026AADD47|nr:hypothetical protein [Caulobacter segnis]